MDSDRADVKSAIVGGFETGGAGYGLRSAGGESRALAARVVAASSVVASSAERAWSRSSNEGQQTRGWKSGNGRALAKHGGRDAEWMGSVELGGVRGDGARGKALGCRCREQLARKRFFL